MCVVVKQIQSNPMEINVSYVDWQSLPGAPPSEPRQHWPAEEAAKEVLYCWFFLVVAVSFVLGCADSLVFWMNVTEDPAIRSACRMVRTRYCRTLGSGPRTWDPSKGAVLTVLRTCVWKPKFVSNASRCNS